MTRRATLSEWLAPTLDHVELSAMNLCGISTGFAELDAVTGGLRPGCVYLLFGATGVGTSTLALDTARETFGTKDAAQTIEN